MKLTVDILLFFYAIVVLCIQEVLSNLERGERYNTGMYYIASSEGEFGKVVFYTRVHNGHCAIMTKKIYSAQA